jgi:hypothetical protein
MRITPTVGLVLVLLIAGCSNKPASQDAQAPGAGTAAAPAQKVAPASSTSTVATPSDSASHAATAAPAPTTAAVKPPTTAASAPPATAQSAASPPSKAPAAANAKARSAAPRAAPAVAAKSQPTLDIAALTQRLEDTKAIGVLSKLALKNQVDDLLDQFRAFYQGKLKTTLAELRRPYDLLVLKVLALLQDGDPSLASAIVASREAIWGILSDPKKFATVA